MILDTPCALCSSSSTRSRNGRVPDFELLRRPTTRPSSVETRLANGTAVPAVTATGTSNSIVAMPAAPSLSTNPVRVDNPSIHRPLWSCAGRHGRYASLSARQQLRGRGISESLEFEGVPRGIGQEHDGLLVSALAADPRLEEKLRPLTPEAFGQRLPRCEIQDHAEMGQRNTLLVGLDAPRDGSGVASEMSDEMVTEEVEVHARFRDEAFRAAEQATEERARVADVADGERQVKGRCRCHASPSSFVPFGRRRHSRMRATICLKRGRVKWLSASWRLKHLLLPPIPPRGLLGGDRSGGGEADARLPRGF